MVSFLEIGRFLFTARPSPILEPWRRRRHEASSTTMPNQPLLRPPCDAVACFLLPGPACLTSHARTADLSHLGVLVAGVPDVLEISLSPIPRCIALLGYHLSSEAFLNRSTTITMAQRLPSYQAERQHPATLCRSLPCRLCAHTRRWQADQSLLAQRTTVSSQAQDPAV